MRTLETRPDLTMQTHGAIRDAIMSGELAPCAPLGQEDLSERLGVSRQPISNALILLRREGLVVDRGRKGQMVAPIDTDKLRDLYQVRGSLDRLAARLAAARDTGNKGDLTELIRTGAAACVTGTINDLVAADIAFHSELYSLSGNKEISATADSFWPHMARSMRVVLEDRSGWSHIWSEHESIAKAIIDGDAERAGDLAARHAEDAGDTTYRRLRDELSS